jgi:hypothetical protein
MMIRWEPVRALWGINPIGEFITPGVRWAQASGLRSELSLKN